MRTAEKTAKLTYFSSKRRLQHDFHRQLFCQPLNTFAKINNIATGSDSLLAKISKKSFRKLSITRKVMERKWHKVFGREVLLGRFKKITQNYFSKAFTVSFWTR